MKRDDIIEMANKAGLQLCCYAEAYPVIAGQLEKFAHLIAAAEREACALLCEEQQFPVIEDETCEPYNMGCRHSAAAIRARSKD